MGVLERERIVSLCQVFTGSVRVFELFVVAFYGVGCECWHSSLVSSRASPASSARVSSRLSSLSLRGRDKNEEGEVEEEDEAHSPMCMRCRANQRSELPKPRTPPRFVLGLDFAPRPTETSFNSTHQPLARSVLRRKNVQSRPGLEWLKAWKTALGL